MHYGHPDVFDRLWFITRGGISKASKTINISEDIFAGFNCTLRGGSISHHEYIQAGHLSTTHPTRNPKPETQNPKPKTQNPKPTPADVP